MIKENNCVITNLRGSNLGVIRLSNLAYPREKEFKIKIGYLEINPIGFDTYGHPVISAEQFEYYKKMKAFMERQKKVLNVEVSYNRVPFCLRPEIFDTIQGIENAIQKSIDDKNVKSLKEMLIKRKQYAFTGKTLHDFVIFGRYYLSTNGKVYNVRNIQYKDISIDADMSERHDLRDTVPMKEIEKMEIFSETHIPNVGERCVICGKEFTLSDIINGDIMENDISEKGHILCFNHYNEFINWQKANEIMDSVYEEPETEEFSEYVDEEDDIREVKYYLYHTSDGDVSIRFKTKVIEIKWHGKFKPFEFESLFENERVTKKIEGEERIIHAWSKDKAIEYLLRAKLN